MLKSSPEAISFGEWSTKPLDSLLTLPTSDCTNPPIETIGSFDVPWDSGVYESAVAICSGISILQSARSTFAHPFAVLRTAQKPSQTETTPNVSDTAAVTPG